ncbi:MAG: ABC transporter permease [Burkholderiales bacterium]
MAVIREWLRRLWDTFRKAPEDAVMEEELRLHFEMVAADLQRRGLTLEEAQRQARLQAGGVAQAMEQRRDQRGLPWLEDLLQDARFGARMLRRAPLVTAVALLTLTLAIGANSAIFSVVNGVLLRPLPYPDPDRIVILGQHTDRGDALDSTTPGNFYDWRAGATAFESMAAFAYTQRIFTWQGNAEPVLGVLSAGSVFEVLGRNPVVGRGFTAAEDVPGAEAVVVLSDRLAGRMFGEAPAVGQRVGINGEPHVVIGVTAPDFGFPDYDAEYWLPTRWDGEFRGNRDQYFLRVVARLGDGVTLEQARAQLNTVMDRIRAAHPRFTQNATAGAVPMKALLVDGVRTRLLTLMGAVVLILLIACANLGNLLLARAATRRRELAVRHALGARPLRLVRQMLTESVLLASVGGIAGLGLGYLLLDVLVTWLPENLPRADGVTLDLTVVSFTAAVSLLAGLAVGLFPALQLAGGAPIDAVREGTRASSRGGRVRTALVVSEVALALMLLAGAGLLVRSFAGLLGVSPGFNTDRLLTFGVSLPAQAYPTPAARVAYFDAAVERERRVTWVRCVEV